jgi:hypothetical protein
MKIFFIDLDLLLLICCGHHQVHTHNFLLVEMGAGEDTEAVHNLCLILKIML